MHTRLVTALSLTAVDLLYIDDQDYMSAQDRDAMQMGTEERSRFLGQVPMFRSWDSYKLLRLAHALVQEEIDKGTVLAKHGMVSKDIHFIVSGRVDILDSLEKRNIITTLLQHDYFGESGFVNKHQRKSQAHMKHAEEFYAVAVSKLDILVLQEANFHLFDMSSTAPLRSAFLAKIEWRRERVQRMKVERAIMRKQYYKMHNEAGHLPIWNMNGQQIGGHTASNSMESFSYDHVDEIEGKKNKDDDLHFQITTVSSPVPSRPSSPGPILLIEQQQHKEYPMSPLDKAYQTALVHPLDDRLSNAKFWTERSPSVEENSTGKLRKLDNIEDIPVLLAKDFDLLMVSSSCNSRQFEKTQDFLSQGKRPLSGKNGVNFQNALSYKLSATRPASSQRSPSTDWQNTNSAEFLPSLSPQRPSTSTSNKLFNTMGMGMNASFDAFHNNNDGMLIHSFHPHLQTHISPNRPATSGGIASLFDDETQDNNTLRGRTKSVGNVQALLQEELYPKGTLMKGITHLSSHPLISIKKPPINSSPAKNSKLALMSASPRTDLISQSVRQFGTSPSKSPQKKTMHR